LFGLIYDLVTCLAQITAVSVEGGASVVDCANAVTITWTTVGPLAAVELALFQADINGLQTRAANITTAPVVNNGSYLWNMGCRTPATGSVVQVSAAADSSVYKDSPAFSILGVQFVAPTRSVLHSC
jgi:hypothetical protein